MPEDKKLNWIVYDVVLIQSIVINVFYAYSQINKWDMMERMTLFIYPFYKILIIGLVMISFLASVAYFVKSFLRTKRFCVCIPVLISITVFIIAQTFFSEEQLRDYNFYEYRKEREKIVKEILDGELKFNSDGIAELPEEFQNESMARGGYVRRVTYLSKEGIYFCTFSGLLETSSGYMYLTDNPDTADNSDEEIVVIKEYEKGWYYCSTN